MELVFQATRRDGKRLGYVSWAVLVACFGLRSCKHSFSYGSYINWVCQMCRMLLVWRYARFETERDDFEAKIVQHRSYIVLAAEVGEVFHLLESDSEFEVVTTWWSSPTSCFKRSTSWRLGWWELSHFSHWIWIICWCEGWSRAKTLNQSGLDEVKIKSCASNELSRTYQMSTLQNYKVCARSDAMIGSFTKTLRLGALTVKQSRHAKDDMSLNTAFFILKVQSEVGVI